MKEKFNAPVLVTTMSIILVVLVVYALTILADPLIRDLTNQTEKRYSDRISNLEKLQKEPLDDPAKDRLLYKNSDIPYHILSEFPKSGTYPPGLKKVIFDDMGKLVTREKNRQDAATNSINAIITFAAIQLIFFIFAVAHEIFQGDVLKENTVCMAINDSFSGLYNPCKNIITYVSSHSSTLIMTTGIAGTFYGLMQGLKSANSDTPLGFDIEMLFIALSISFISTLTGIFGGVVVRLIQQSFSGRATTMKDLVKAVDAFTVKYSMDKDATSPEETNAYEEQPDPRKSHHSGKSGTVNNETIVQVYASSMQANEAHATKLDKIEEMIAHMTSDQKKHWQEQTETTSQMRHSLDFIKKHLPKTKGRRR